MNNRYEIPLPGLVGSKPIAFMATLGLLRTLAAMDKNYHPKIRWEMQDDWIPILSLRRIENLDQLIETLIKYNPELSKYDWLNLESAEIKVPVNMFRGWMEIFSTKSTLSHRETIDFIASFGSELVVITSGDNKGKVKPSLLCMTSGNQMYFNSIRETLDDVNKAIDKRDRYMELLTGPWKYDDPNHSLGWDPTMERLHALRPKAPTNDKGKFSSVRLAVWFAALSLPFFPTLSKNNEINCACFTRANRKNNWLFRWPLWGAEIGIDEIKLLLTNSSIGNVEPNFRMRKILEPLGVKAVYQSIQYVSSHGYGIFRPAEMIPW
ncbi:MAG: hypothetical protein G8345_03540 [Magnetococcales bacterium]|nr:hypothetical protein [Magnetococcales bacterium]NGZ25948.1 hypothetical protein [Magnetococcales bacterium]